MNMIVLSPAQIEQLYALLPHTASACVEAITREVPGYDRAFDSKLRGNIERAVHQALAAFVGSLAKPDTSDAVSEMAKGAYRLGQGEATSGRSTDALIAAYRVGARVAWDNVAESLVARGESAKVVAQLASMTFAYIDQLSAASLAGHNQALTERTAEVARRREQLTAALASGESASTLNALAENAHWKPPATLTAIVIDGPPSRMLVAMAGERTLWSTGGGGTSVGLVPNLAPGLRERLLSAVGPTAAALGPTTPWMEVSESIRRAHRAKARRPSAHSDVLELLPELLMTADPFVANLLKERALGPLADQTPAKQQLQAQTLHSWLLHQGRRDDVAEHLHVHPQTVRYRMTGLREAYGDALKDPRAVLELILGLSVALSDEAGFEGASE